MDSGAYKSIRQKCTTFNIASGSLSSGGVAGRKLSSSVAAVLLPFLLACMALACSQIVAASQFVGRILTGAWTEICLNVFDNILLFS